MLTLRISRLVETRSALVTERSVDVTLGNSAPRTLWYRCTAPDAPLPAADRLDAFAIAMVMPAMRLAEAMHLEGPVSRSLLANLEEFVEAWSRILPGTYRRIPITADSEVPDRDAVSAPAVVSYSGGVDGSFALMRHRNGLAGRRSRPVGGLAMLHGFDVPIANQVGFDAVVARGQVFAHEAGLPLFTIATNWVDLMRHSAHDWEMEWLPGIVSSLAQLDQRFGAAIVGAGIDYHWFRDILESTLPFTDGLLSSGNFAVVREGAGFTRVEKIEAIAAWPATIDHLRVCLYDAKVGGGNCGHCEKCVRTKLAFLALKRPVPQALGGRVSLPEIAAMRPAGRIALAFHREVIDAAQANRAGGAWLLALRAIVAFHAVRVRYLPWLPPILRPLGRVGPIRRLFFWASRHLGVEAKPASRNEIAAPATTASANR